ILTTHSRTQNSPPMQQSIATAEIHSSRPVNLAGNMHGADRVASVLQNGFTHRIFPAHLQLIPQMHELYEMQLASAEAALLGDKELVRNAGFFARVGDQWTRHFLICSGEPLRLPKHSSSQLRSFFQTNQ